MNYPTNLPYIGEVFLLLHASTVQIMGLCSMARKRDSAFMSLCAALRCPLPLAAQRTMSCGCGRVAVTQLGQEQDSLKEDASSRV